MLAHDRLIEEAVARGGPTMNLPVYLFYTAG